MRQTKLHESLVGGGGNIADTTSEIADLASYNGFLNYQNTSLSDAKYVLKSVYNVHTHTQDKIEGLILPVNGSIGVGLGNYGSVVSGQINVAIGGSNLGSLTSGEVNIALGSSVLQNCTTGSYNFGAGHMAIAGCSTGSYNIGLGYQTLLNTQDGNKNIAIGYQAGSNPIGKSNNIFIGSDNFVIGNISDQNKTKIGNSSTTKTVKTSEKML